jgi:hypothetical protein
MIPSPGRIVHYKLAEGDVAAIKQLKGQGNLQVFLDGDCSYWATSRKQGDDPCQWSEPPRV